MPLGRLAAGALIALLCVPAAAVPDWTTHRVIGAIEVYADDEVPHRFYYAPGALELGARATGAPDVQLLQLRYLDEAGTLAFLGALTVRIRSAEPSAQELARVRSALQRSELRMELELRPLPITRFESQILLPGAGSEERPLALPGSLEHEPGRGRSGTIDERITVDLDPGTSQLVTQLAESGSLVMSLNYRFESSGRGDPVREIEVSGEGAELPEDLPSIDESDGAVREIETRTVRAGAVEVVLDARRWPGLVERVDFESHAPPRYARLRVYCYDFRDPDPDSALLFRKVEAEATAVDGSTIATELKFSASEPSVYAKTLRFDRAVRVDRPFRYRVIDGYRDGRKQTTAWLDRASWAAILDVSTRAMDL